MIELSHQNQEVLDILDTWLDAQSEGSSDYDQKLHRPASKVMLRVIMSAGAKFRTSRELPADEYSSVNKLLKTTWEAIQEEVTQKLPGETYKWWEGVLLIGDSSLETKKSRRTKLLGMSTEHQKMWAEWRQRNLEGGYRQVYTIGVAFGVSHGKRKLR